MTVSFPIEGDVITPSYNTKDQRTVTDLESLFVEAWNAGVTAIVWAQYTPYFNDGDVCVFGARGEVWSNAELDDNDIRNAEVYADYDTDGKWLDLPYRPGERYDLEMRMYVPIPDYVVPAGMYEAGKVLDAIGSGKFNKVLIDNFGEHAKVVATPEKFYVEYYEHD